MQSRVSLIQKIIGNVADKIRQRYEDQSQSQSKVSYFYDSELARNKRAKAYKLAETIKAVTLESLYTADELIVILKEAEKDKYSEIMECYKKEILLIIGENKSTVEQLCVPTNASLGTYESFLAVMSFALDMVIKLCPEYCLSINDLLSDGDNCKMHVKFIQVLINYELDKLIDRKLNEWSTVEKLKEKATDWHGEKFNNKIEAMKEIIKELLNSLSESEINSKDEFTLNKKVLTYVDVAQNREQEIQNKLNDKIEPQEAMSIAAKIVNSIWKIGEKSYQLVCKESHLATVLSEFKKELTVRLTEQDNYQKVLKRMASNG